MSKKLALYSCLLLCLASSMPHAQAVILQDSTNQIPKAECNICFYEKNKDEIVSLSCGHAFCKECFANAINLALKEKNLVNIRCPHYLCYNKPLPLADIQNCLTQEQKSNLNQLQTQNWLAQQSHTKHCQTPDCNFTFINESKCQSNITCKQCHKTYCAQCLMNHPEYMSCQSAKEKYSTADEKANQSWKQAHSKQCPQCHTNIEKNRGCDHMTCSKCRYEFCWKCMEKYPCDIARCITINRCIDHTAILPTEINNRAARNEINPPEIVNIENRLTQLAPEQLIEFTNNFLTQINRGVDGLQALNNELERVENQVAQIEVRADMPRDFHGFTRMLTDAGIRVHINANGTLRITARMRWDTFNRILDQANALYR